MKNKQATEVHYILKELETPLSIAIEGTNLLKGYFDTHQDLRQKQVFNSLQTNLERMAAFLKGLAESLNETPLKPKTFVHFDILQHIQQTCLTHDQLFLQRQLHYKVTASADLPKVFANPDQIFVVLSHLVSNAIKFAPRGGEIDIRARETNLRQGTGIEISIINESPNFTERDRYQIFEQFYSTKDSNNIVGMGLTICREIVQKSGGQLWVDIPSKGKVAFTFIIPCAEVVSPAKAKGSQTYKYDITIVNYKELKDRIGPEKSTSILHRIEESVRKLVRYPLDVVASFETNGVISTIYETQEGFASSIASRISKKLGEEEYKLGKSVVAVQFKYHLSVLQ